MNKDFSHVNYKIGNKFKKKCKWKKKKSMKKIRKRGMKRYSSNSNKRKH